MNRRRNLALSLFFSLILMLAIPAASIMRASALMRSCKATVTAGMRNGILRGNIRKFSYQFQPTRDIISSPSFCQDETTSRYGSVAAAAVAAACLSATALYSSSVDCQDNNEVKSAPAVTVTNKFTGTAFYPPIKAFDEGLLKVSDLHTIAYAQYGNPSGKPVLFVHGGPGGGTEPNMARYFDPSIYRVVLVDQRGCGNSFPFANLVDNTTYDSVSDFEQLRIKLNVEKWLVFGGSWGSTLSLAYAMKHPNRVTELVLRGIFLIRKKEIDWLYQGPGANYLFPEDWKQYEEAIPADERGDYLNAYGRRLRGELGEEEMRKAAKAWSIWEGRTSKLVQDPWDVVKDRFGADDFSLAFARIENHYFTNEGFFPRDGYLLEKENIDAIRHIPTVIVQGRYDVVCPAISAYDLKTVFPEAQLIMTLAGHSGYEVENIKHLVAACDRFKVSPGLDQ